MSNQWMKWVAVGLGLAAGACGGRAKGAGDAVSPVVLAPADVATASTETIGEGVAVTGPLNPYHVAEVRAQVPGVLTDLRVDRGSRVSAGEVMAQIQADGIRSQAASAKAAVAAAQAGLAVATKQLESSKKLHAAGAVSDFDLQQAQAGYDAAQAQLAAAHAGDAAAAEAARHASVVAPFAGEVSVRTVNQGEAVNPGQSLLTVVDPAILEFQGTVPVEQAATVRAGQEVEIGLDAYPGRVFRGTVARVDPTASAQTRQVGVYVRLANQNRGVLGGVYASGRILTGSSHQGIVVPLAALRGAGQDSYVWAVRGNRAVKQAVKLGARDERRGWVEVLEGVQAGETVVAAAGDLADGTPVRVAAPAGVSPVERGAAPAAAGR